MGDSDEIYLGQDVYAIGNPIGFEFQRTVTKGIISGINRTIRIDEKGFYFSRTRKSVLRNGKGFI